MTTPARAASRNRHGLVDRKGARDVNAQRLAASLEFPGVKGAAGHAGAYAFMVQQVGGGGRFVANTEIGGRTHDNGAQRAADRDGDHVAGHGVAAANASVEAGLDDVDQAALGDQIDAHVRMELQEFEYQRGQDHPRRAERW